MKINTKRVGKWGIFEISIRTDNSYNNPFTDVELYGYFQKDGPVKRIKGFYDGESIWKIRFMPEAEGEYTFITRSNDSNLDGVQGDFICVSPSDDNHGPVEVNNKYHFSYADGTPCFVMGTTVYAWTYRPEEVRKKTLESIEKYGFNKARMLFFPKYLAGMDEINLTHEPPVLPYQGEKHNFDYQRFNLDYFRNFENRVKDLMEIGVEADVILFHNYDFGMWGIDEGMSDDDAIFYLDYLMARIGSYRNVWWSLANEYDLVKNPDGSGAHAEFHRRDWDRIGNYIKENDPYGHLTSIHNFGPVYPDREWITHVSYQFPNTYTLLMDLKNKYQKPVVNDEYQYEGNLSYGWGNLSPEDEVFRHWLTVMAGGYGTHGECYVVDGNKRDIFWTYGGEMVGESAPRLKYLKEIVKDLPYQEMAPDHTLVDGRNNFCISKDDDIYLFLFTEDSSKHVFWLTQNTFKNVQENEYQAIIYDIWNCKILDEIVCKASKVEIDYSGWIAVKLIKLK